RSQFVSAFRHKLLCHKAFKARFMYRFHNSGIVQLLCFVDLITARHTAGMVVSEVGMVILYGTDNISFHDLHMVDIIEQLKAVRPDSFGKPYAPGGMIALIIRVIYFAVEQL